MPPSVALPTTLFLVSRIGCLRSEPLCFGFSVSPLCSELESTCHDPPSDLFIIFLFVPAMFVVLPYVGV